MKHIIFSLSILSIFAALPFAAPTAEAGETIMYDTPVEGVTNIGARVRAGYDISSSILKVLPKGTVVTLFGEEHGWYKLQHEGTVGYTGLWLIDKTGNTAEQTVRPVQERVEEKASVEKEKRTGTYLYRSRVRADRNTATQTLDILEPGSTVAVLSHVDGWYQVKLSDGRIGWSADWLLSTAEGEVKEETREPEPKKTTVSSAERGRYLYRSNVRSSGNAGASIVTTVNAGTEADILAASGGWYRVRFSNGTEGWSADWLIQKTEKKAATAEPANATVVTGKVHEPIRGSVSAQVGSVPDGVDLVELNKYWLKKINALRAERGLRELVLDQRWVETAAEYAAYMGQTGATNHERADGSSMHDWIDAKALAFTERYSDGGWQTNYFTENISWGYADGTTESVKGVLDRSLEFFLGEASYNGAHYRTIYHADWNSVGLGFYFAPIGGGKHKVSVAYHYGSLAL